MGCPPLAIWLQTLCRVLPYLISSGRDPRNETLPQDPQCPQLRASPELLAAACEGRGLEVALARLHLAALRDSGSGSGSGPGPGPGVARVLRGSEGLVLGAALGGPPGAPQNFSTRVLDAAAQVLGGRCPQARLELEVGEDSLSVPCPQVLGYRRTGAVAVAFLVYKEGPELLGGVTEGGPGSLNSRVVGGALGTPGGADDVGDDVTSDGTAGGVGDVTANVVTNVTFNVTFTLTLRHRTALRPDQDSLCVSWELRGSRGHWSRRGCARLGGDSNTSICACSHFSTFAVLTALQPLPASPALAVVSRVALALSLLCLLLAIGTFALCPPRAGVGPTLHLHLSLCLFAAQLLFLGAVTRTHPRVLCAVTAGLLHFLFLCCFSWMFLEGLQLLLTVRNLRVLNYGHGQGLRGYLIFPVGYGAPALVVAVSAAVRPQGYGTERHCWLNIEGGFIWSFLGPVCAIILVNLGFFLTTLWTLRERLSSLNADVSSLKSTRLMTFKALAHVVILGCTWALGLLQGPGHSPALAFIFTIVNSLQGAFIFLVYCLLNRQVMEQYRRWFGALGRWGHARDTPSSELPVTYVSSVTEGERSQPHSSGGCSWEK
ncbi:adhesion G protein-coupled receptor E3-like [Aphelocoma coerulescens]|uniref:adhesion G protein-coupled receptor E3-like n=1 Tax=Aphelocoma coerulescens TaxID=39617 RepID=UPI0036051FE3